MIPPAIWKDTREIPIACSSACPASPKNTRMPKAVGTPMSAARRRSAGVSSAVAPRNRERWPTGSSIAQRVRNCVAIRFWSSSIEGASRAGA
jgi:hypothetical protein